MSPREKKTVFGNVLVGQPEDVGDRLVRTTGFRKLCQESLSAATKASSQKGFWNPEGWILQKVDELNQKFPSMHIRFATYVVQDSACFYLARWELWAQSVVKTFLPGEKNGSFSVSRTSGLIETLGGKCFCHYFCFIKEIALSIESLNPSNLSHSEG